MKFFLFFVKGKAKMKYVWRGPSDIRFRGAAAQSQARRKAMMQARANQRRATGLSQDGRGYWSQRG
jgi:hypothetical protein